MSVSEKNGMSAWCDPSYAKPHHDRCHVPECACDCHGDRDQAVLW